MSDIYLSLTETPSVVTLSQPVVASVMVNTVTVANVVSVNVVTMPAITVQAAVSGGLSNAELRASAVTVAVTTMPALSISSVSISNFPSTQTIAGTVTANLIGRDGTGPGFDRRIACDSSGNTIVNIHAGDGSGPISNVNGLLVRGTVTIGSLPAISGTVTANTNLNAPDFESLQNLTLVSNDGGSLGSGEVLWAGESTAISTSLTIPTSAVKGRAFLVVVENNGGGTFSIQGQFHGCGTQAGGFADSSNYFTVKGASRGFNTSAISVTNNGTPVSYLFCAGFSSASTGVGSRLLETLPFDLNFGVHFVSGSGGCTIKIYKVSLPNDLYLPSVIGGNLRTWLSSPVATVTVGNSVTIGSLPTLAPQLPRVTFIDGSGTVVTANSAVTLFASSTTRSYLLVQVTTGSAFVNVGATATTVNGINLTAGQGYAWETTIPQGLVSLISTTTSSRWVAKEA